MVVAALNRRTMKRNGRFVMLMTMNRTPHLFCTLLATLALAGCGTMRSSVVFEPAGGQPTTAAPAMSARTATASPAASPARTPIPGGTYVVARGDTLYSIAFRSGVDFRDLAQWNGVAAPFTIWPGQTLKLSPPTGAVAPAAASPVAATEPVFETIPAKPPATASASVGAPKAVAAGSTATQPVASAATAIGAGASATVAAVPVAGETAPPHLPPAAPPAAVGASHSAGGITWRWPASGSVIKRFNSGDAIPGIEIAGKSGEPVNAAAGGVVVYSGNGLVGYGELVIIKHSDSYLSAYGHNRKRLVKEGQHVSVGQQIAEMGSTGASRDELQFQIRKDGNPVDPLKYLPAQ
jgi:lipoprotein NlpD